MSTKFTKAEILLIGLVTAKLFTPENTNISEYSSDRVAIDVTDTMAYHNEIDVTRELFVDNL